MSIIILNNPLPQIGRLEIHAPKMKDADTIFFFVKINGTSASIELKSDDTWRTQGIHGRFPKTISTLIQQQIKYRYLGVL